MKHLAYAGIAVNLIILANAIFFTSSLVAIITSVLAIASFAIWLDMEEK